MHRCLQLARLGAGYVAPNPMVGSVLVYKDRIIGEGYHRQYGQAHAEVNCIASVKPEDVPFISDSTIYVSLEPCAHWGKTPPCADLIIRHKIGRVVVGCRDPFPEVDGKGIEKLRAAGLQVEVGVLEQDCISINRRFFKFHTGRRPYIILKWAQSADGVIGGGSGSGMGGGPSSGMGGERGSRMGEGPGSGMGEEPGGRERVFISNEFTNRLVHKWRSEEAGILVGTRTALMDDPSLTVRLWEGPNPIRIVVDRELKLPATLRLFDGEVRTIVLNNRRQGLDGNIEYYQLTEDGNPMVALAAALYEMRVQSVLVEGGAAMLQSFIDAGYWDEARVITNETMYRAAGVRAPVLKEPVLVSTEACFSDSIRYYRNPLSLS